MGIEEISYPVVIPKVSAGTGTAILSATAMTAANTFQDLDLSGANGLDATTFGFVCLEITVDAAVTYAIKPKGYGSSTFTRHYHGASSAFGGCVVHFEASGDYAYVAVATDSSGIVQHAAGDNTTKFTIKVVGYIR